MIEAPEVMTQEQFRERLWRLLTRFGRKPGESQLAFIEAKLEELARLKDRNCCPVCHHEFEMGQPPHFKPEESGEGHDGERTVHWVSGTQTCPNCAATWTYGDSD